METLSFLALILLSLAGYSGGAVGRASQARDLKPRGIDLALVLMIWAGAISSRLIWALNRWLLVLAWVLIAALLGYLAGVLRKETEPQKKRSLEVEEIPSAGLPRIWALWKDFSRRMGAFQSRTILSLFYFLIVSPFALAVKIFSDPLSLKHRSVESYWLHKQEGKADFEEFRRQF